eukprot:gnl/TRDRNA2_/TRDRNA2_161753_c1_seq2.p1 gnl/TRDRNA2_/TRDRNA2_161753_c1~~gnl/TRDRNA2_/TRDRNA2_161753_c1_seq2.p1  ORF type:complete len:475 (+),score=93.48 gnl/TRDRNA2_/TRDRNA2_161753_c1_seq2:67-1425(+)
MDGEAGGVFSPVEEGALCLPCDPDTHFAYALTARSALEAAERLQRAPLIALGAWREEAPFWHTPTTVLAACTTERCELFDLVALRLDNSGLWPEASNALRMLLSDAHILKVVYGDDTLHSWATSLGLGIPNTLRQGDRDPLGPTLDLREVVASVLDRPPEDPGCAWPSVARRFLGLRLCPEEANSNWARRPLRNSQLHCAAVEAWTQIPVLLALCAYGVVPRSLIDQLIVLQIKVKQLNKAKVTKHLPGQLAPPGRLAAESAAAQAAQATGMPGTPGAAVAAGAAVVAAAVAAAVAENGPVLPPLPVPTRIAKLRRAVSSRASGSLSAGTIVEVFEERFGDLAIVAPAASNSDDAMHTVPTSTLIATNGWELPQWLAKLPRPKPLEAGDEAPRQDAVPEAKCRVPAGRGAAASAALSPAECEEALQVLLDGVYNRESAREVLERLYAAQESM